MSSFYATGSTGYRMLSSVAGFSVCHRKTLNGQALYLKISPKLIVMYADMYSLSVVLCYLP